MSTEIKARDWYKAQTHQEQCKLFWEAVGEQWEALLNLCRTYHPYYRKKHAHKISAPMAEQACIGERKEIAAVTTADPVCEMERAKQEGNVDLLIELANAIWFGMPESMVSREEEGFGLLCDICSDGPRSGDDEDDQELDNVEEPDIDSSWLTEDEDTGTSFDDEDE